jgi:hypothetical protein
MLVILHELAISITYKTSGSQREIYEKEFADVKDDFLKLIKSKLFRDLCGEVKGVRSCFGVYEVFVYQKK